MNSAMISIGGIRLLLRGDAPDQLLDRYAGFRVHSGKPDITFACAFTDSRLTAGRSLADVCCDDRGGFRAARGDFACAWRGARGKLTCRNSPYSLDACLRVVLSAALLCRGGMLVHAAAVRINGAARLFIGPSGAGKTTIARRVGRCPVLSDEIVAIGRNASGRAAAWGTPFWGEMGTGPALVKPAPLGTLCFLKKSRRLDRLSLAPTRAACRLLQCCCLFGNDARLAANALHNAIWFAHNVPCCELRFAKGSRIMAAFLNSRER